MELCSATSVESSRRDLLIDVAEHRSILKNDQNKFYPRFSFTPKTGIAFPKTGVLFLLWYVSCVVKEHEKTMAVYPDDWN